MHKLNEPLHPLCKIRNIFSHLGQLASKSRANTTYNTANKRSKCLANFAHSGNGVIKATGDNAGIAMLVAVVAIAGTMGVAVRKSRDAE